MTRLVHSKVSRHIFMSGNSPSGQIRSWNQDAISLESGQSSDEGLGGCLELLAADIGGI